MLFKYAFFVCFDFCLVKMFYANALSQWFRNFSLFTVLLLIRFEFFTLEHAFAPIDPFWHSMFFTSILVFFRLICFCLKHIQSHRDNDYSCQGPHGFDICLFGCNFSRRRICRHQAIFCFEFGLIFCSDASIYTESMISKFWYLYMFVFTCIWLVSISTLTHLFALNEWFLLS